MIPLSKSKPDWNSLLDLSSKLGIYPTRALDTANIKPETHLHYLTCLWNLDETEKIDINTFPDFLLHHIHLSFLYHCTVAIESYLMERSNNLVMRSVKTNGINSIGLISGTLYQWKRLIVESKDYKRDIDYIEYINKIHQMLNQMGYSRIFEGYSQIMINKGAYILVP